MPRSYEVAVQITEREAYDLAREYDRRGLGIDLGGYVLGPMDSIIKKIHEAVKKEAGRKEKENEDEGAGNNQ